MAFQVVPPVQVGDGKLRAQFDFGRLVSRGLVRVRLGPYWDQDYLSEASHGEVVLDLAGVAPGLYSLSFELDTPEGLEVIEWPKVIIL